MEPKQQNFKLVGTFTTAVFLFFLLARVLGRGMTDEVGSQEHFHLSHAELSTLSQSGA